MRRLQLCFGSGETDLRNGVLASSEDQMAGHASADEVDAVLDTAVNTSPLLDDSAKIRLIGVDGTTESADAGNTSASA